MLREFSKNIIDINLLNNNNHSTINQINKNTWVLSSLQPQQSVTISYNVYAYDFGIRTAYLDNKRAYFNCTSLCLYIVGEKHLPHHLQIANIPQSWQIATGLLESGPNTFIVSSYDDLIDYPFEIARLTTLNLNVCGVPHTIALSGIIPEDFNHNQLINDVIKICETQIKLFDNTATAPFKHYVFLLHLGGNIYTGLEHRNSTALLAPYYSLPLHFQGKNAENYIKLLGLISHEYFHAWNVKRIKPEVFSPYNLDAENYTHLLWWFEGITSYYDDLVLYRCGIIDEKKYLSLMLDNINNVYKFNGVNKQTLANSSLTSWIKYYRQDANSPNAIVSYYVKGAIFGACLDILIRNKTNYRQSLDDILVELYKKWQEDGCGVNEATFVELIQGFIITPDNFLFDLINKFVYTTDMLPLKDIFALVGVELIATNNREFTEKGKIIEKEDEIPTRKFELGLKLSKEAIGFKISNVYNNTLAENLGLCPEDVIIAINNIKLTDVNRQINSLQLNESIQISYFRREVLYQVSGVVQNHQSCNIFYAKIVDKNGLIKWLMPKSIQG